MKKNIIYIIVSLIFISCVEKIPTNEDGNFKYSAVLIDTMGILPFDSSIGYAPFKHREITLESTSYYESLNNRIKYYGQTDKNGYIEFLNLPYSEFLFYSNFIDTVRYNSITGRWDSTKLGAIKFITNIENNPQNEIIYTIQVEPNLVINEIYYAGSDRSTYYMYDMFIELYNASQEITYLDGLLLCRASQRSHPDMETNDFVQALYVFQFPGTPLIGTEYPLNPGEFTVVAGDAVDHSELITNAVDLSDAEWEFFNSIAGEHDNPAMNVSNILPDRTVDFLISPSHNAIILADGSYWEYGESYVSGSKQYVHIPINTVIDAVEYSSSSESTKELTRRLDAGFAGIGMSKYNGKSVERRIPGFDTNNSIIDFVILDVPTPGY